MTTGQHPAVPPSSGANLQILGVKNGKLAIFGSSSLGLAAGGILATVIGVAGPETLKVPFCPEVPIVEEATEKPEPTGEPEPEEWQGQLGAVEKRISVLERQDE